MLNKNQTFRNVASGKEILKELEKAQQQPVRPVGARSLDDDSEESPWGIIKKKRSVERLNSVQLHRVGTVLSGNISVIADAIIGGFNLSDALEERKGDIQYRMLMGEAVTPNEILELESLTETLHKMNPETLPQEIQKLSAFADAYEAIIKKRG